MIGNYNQSFTTLEIGGSNPVISNFIDYLSTSFVIKIIFIENVVGIAPKLYRKYENKEKEEARNGPFFTISN